MMMRSDSTITSPRSRSTCMGANRSPRPERPTRLRVLGAPRRQDTSRTSMSSRLRNLETRLGNLGDRGPLGMVIRGFGNLGAAMLEPLSLGSQLGENFGRFGIITQGLVTTVATFALGLGGLAVAF